MINSSKGFYISSNETPMPDKSIGNSPFGNVPERPKSLETIDNIIYFYSEIERQSILQLNKTLKNIANTNMAELINKKMPQPYPILLHIMSYGGDIFSGLAAMDQILSVRETNPVITIVDGCCASAATFLSIVGTKRIITPNSFMLIHQLSSIFWGKYSEIKDEALNLDRFMNKIKELYGKYTKVPAKELNEILKHDIWFSPKECLKYGLVDSISVL